MKKFLITILIIGILIAGISPLSVNAQGALERASNARMEIETIYDACMRQANTLPAGEQAAAKQKCEANKTAQIAQLNQSNSNSSADDPMGKIGCNSIGTASILACLTRVVQFFFATLPPLLAGIAARLFDFSIILTLSSKLYGLGFINKIWAVVRDFSNIFFILVLLFAAFETILGIGHGGAKKTIAAVVLMALLVNFSLFFTKVVIDAGNILALVFYNSVEVKGSPEKPISNFQESGIHEKSISRAIVSNFPISTVMNGGNFQTETSRTGGAAVGGVGGALAGCTLGALGGPIGCAGGAVVGLIGGYLFGGTTTLDTQSYFLIMGVMVAYGIVFYIFTYALVVAAFSFLARMLTLIMLMIASPFAFVSYAVPGLKKINRVGFDSWVHTLISASFMGVVFMFMLYVIYRIMDANFVKQMADPGIQNGNLLEFLVITFLPVILIAMLLLAAAKYSKKASGEVSERLIGLGKAAAGLAIGGAALSTGLAGRAAIGAGSAALTRGGRAFGVNGLAGRPGRAMDYGTKYDKWRKEYEEWKRNGSVGAAPVRPSASSYSIRERIGGRINAAQLKSGRVTHENDEWDKLKKGAHLDGVANDRLSAVDYQNLEKEFLDKKRSDIERDIKRGRNDKNEDVLMSGNGILNAKGEDDYKSQRRNAVKAMVRPGRGTLTKEEEKKVENILNKEVSAIVGTTVPLVAKDRFHHLQEGIKEKVGIPDLVRARSTSGSYDPRSLVNISAEKRGGIGAKAAAGIIAAVATGIKAGLKGAGGIDIGTPKRDFILDLKETISSSLKSINVKVDIKHDSGGHGKDDHGTSGGGHH